MVDSTRKSIRTTGRCLCSTRHHRSNRSNQAITLLNSGDVHAPIKTMINNQGRGREGRASRRRSTATTAGSSRTRPVPVPMPGSPTVCSSRPRNHCRRERIPWRVPTAAATAGGPDARGSWAATARRGRRAPKGRSPDDAAAEGFFGRMRTESVHPGHREERTRDEALAPVDDCIRWHDHERIKRSLGWMSPVQYRQSQGTAA